MYDQSVSSGVAHQHRWRPCVPVVSWCCFAMRGRLKVSDGTAFAVHYGRCLFQGLRQIFVVCSFAFSCILRKFVWLSRRCPIMCFVVFLLMFSRNGIHLQRCRYVWVILSAFLRVVGAVCSRLWAMMRGGAVGLIAFSFVASLRFVVATCGAALAAAAAFGLWVLCTARCVLYVPFLSLIVAMTSSCDGCSCLRQMFPPLALKVIWQSLSGTN